MEQNPPFILILLASSVALLYGILAPSKDREFSCMHGLHRSRSLPFTHPKRWRILRFLVDPPVAVEQSSPATGRVCYHQFHPAAETSYELIHCPDKYAYSQN